MSTLTDAMAKQYFNSFSPAEIKTWQKNQGLPQDGVVGPETIKAYNSYKSRVQANSGPQGKLGKTGPTMGNMNARFNVADDGPGYGETTGGFWSDTGDFLMSEGGQAAMMAGTAVLGALSDQQAPTTQVQQAARHGQGDAMGTLAGLISPISNVSAPAPKPPGYRGGFV